MLTQLILFILDAVIGFFSILLIARFMMQWQRVSFRNQLGAFIVAATDWAVLPTRRVVPGLFGLDLSSFVLAWLAQTLLVLVEFWLRDLPVGNAPGAAVLVVALLGMIATIKMMLYVLIGAVIIAAVLSWVNPYSPVAPIFNALTRAFLAPVQRVIPPIANVDLSPLVLLLILQVILVLVAYLRASVVQLLA